MKLLFEEYPYSLEAIKRFCLPSGDELFIRTKRGNAVFNCVGYFYSSALNDAVFILPKVLIGSNEESSSPLAFGKYRPESLIDFDAVTASEEQVMPKEAEKEFIFRLAVWLYQAIDQYSQLRRCLPIGTTQTLICAHISTLFFNSFAFTKSTTGFSHTYPCFTPAE